MYILIDKQPFNIFDWRPCGVEWIYDSDSDEYNELKDKCFAYERGEEIEKEVMDELERFPLYHSMISNDTTLKYDCWEYFKSKISNKSLNIPKLWCFVLIRKSDGKHYNSKFYKTEEYAQNKLNELLTLINTITASLPKFES